MDEREVGDGGRAVPLTPEAAALFDEKGSGNALGVRRVMQILHRASGGFTKKIRVLDLVPALSGLGLLAFMIYLQVSFDDALAFAHVRGAGIRAM